MMKNLLTILALFACTALIAQEKGVTPTTPHSVLATPHSTRAVVIGISDYQDKDIPDLRFADKDAEAFANFLRSPAGGGLDNDHLKVLTNENATAGRIAEALDALIEQAKEGDQVIIYFSGHGDVERKTVSQPGFLLAWDAPSRVYMGGGTYSLAFLQEIVTTLSTQNLAKVTVITDACHAGKLSGSQIGGAQLTSANLAKQYANEVKILSCQPNEFSLEGEQWGGGRGVFSYHLVDGLFGLADRNGDGTVTVGEIDRYLEDKVTAEAAPQSQVPMLLGNKTDRLATVNAAVLADLQKNKAGGMPIFTATESRGFEDEVLAKVDTSIREMYRAFKLAVLEKRFFAPSENVGEVRNLADVPPAADALYTQLIGVEALAPLRGMMKRNYAAALQDEAQQVMNIMLKTGLTSEVLSAAKATVVYRNYPTYLDRAAELLGSKHYMYATLQARKFFFQGKIQTTKTESWKNYFQALQWQGDLPHAFVELISICSAEQVDSAEIFANNAMKISPEWVMPYARLARFYEGKMKQPHKAEALLDAASEVDSNSAFIWYEKAGFYGRQNDFITAEYWYKMVIASSAEEICFPCASHNLGTLYKRARRYAEAEIQFKKAIQLDSTFEWAYINLGMLYYITRRFVEAEAPFKKAIQLDSTSARNYSNLGNIYNVTSRFDEAEPHLKKAIQLDSNYVLAISNLAVVYLNTERYEEAVPYYKKSIQLDSTYARDFADLGFVLEKTQRFSEAELHYKKAIQLDSSDIVPFIGLGNLCLTTGRYAEAEIHYKKAIALDSTKAPSRRHLGMVCFKTNRPDEARQSFLKAITLNPNYAGALLGMAYVLAAEGKTEDAIGYVEQAIGKGSTFEQLESDEDLGPLRATPEWAALMKKYFPDKIKD